MFGWFHCSAVHSLSLSVDMPISSNLLVPPFVLPQFHHFKAELVLGTVRTGHLRYHSRCRACTDALCMSDEVWLHRLGAGDVMRHLPYFNVSDRLVAVLLCGKLVPVVVPWLWKLLGAWISISLALGQGLGFALMIASSFGATSTGAFRLLCLCGYFSCLWYFCCCIWMCHTNWWVHELMNIVTLTWAIARPLYLVYAAGGALLFSGLFSERKEKLL